MAAPNAVVSVVVGRDTGTRSWSAWICSSRSRTAAPPSTRNAASSVPTSFMASTTSRTWYAMASITARAMWAAPTPRVSPVMVPARVGVPPRAAEAGEGGHHEHALAVVDLRRERSDAGRLVDEPEPVAQPLDGGTR